ncbi:hypothetical protein MRB53_037170 [Persea americana]|nr:hypothetical protein MRB53_037170 [Persea americana]
MPLAGRTITHFIQNMLRERGEPDSSLQTSEAIKERFCYTAPDLIKEYAKYDREPDRFQQYTVENPGKKPVVVDIGYERFLAVEAAYFAPEISSSDFLTPLPNMVDDVVQSSPIDVRRALYRNIVLSGGSTMFKDFGRRLQRDIKQLVDTRIQASEAKSKGAKSGGLDVNVISYKSQRYAPFLGASLLASTPEFKSSCYTRADYAEYGASLFRRVNPLSRLACHVEARVCRGRVPLRALPTSVKARSINTTIEPHVFMPPHAVFDLRARQALSIHPGLLDSPHPSARLACTTTVQGY